VYWNRQYEPATLAEDDRVKSGLSRLGLRVETHPGSLLCEPWEVRTRNGAGYRVFTPFWRHLQSALSIDDPLPEPIRLDSPGDLDSLDLGALALLPTIRWDSKLAARWRVGEVAAESVLSSFCDTRLTRYAEDRDRLGKSGTTHLSPALHFGELSSRQAWHAAVRARDTGLSSVSGCESFLRQLGWRDFAWHLLFHFPQLPEKPVAARFRHFPWTNGYEESLQAWREGKTGIPVVDAGMRQLWQTGWMHNRARMLTASLLCKNLLIPWQRGEAWFWDTLVDADLANNAMGWQWVAGSGPDAAPYFRVFNPVRQGERFDPDGQYVRRWIPELAALDADWIHHPWDAPANELAKAGVTLGTNYPKPIVDLPISRRTALEAYAATKPR